jgi:predicted N-acetyltransferase YhbS
MAQINQSSFSSVRLKPIQRIPQEIVFSLINELQSDRRYIGKVNECEIKLGAFIGGEIVGFIVANKSSSRQSGATVLSAPLMWVKQGYRRKGIASKLVYRLLGEAKTRKLPGIDITQMTFGTTRMVEKIERRAVEKNLPLVSGIQKIKGSKLKNAFIRAKR